MKARGKLLKNAKGEYELEVHPYPHVPEEVDIISLKELVEDLENQEVVVDVIPSRGGLPPRGTVRIKPISIAIPHYREVYGSVCSADVEGTPPIPQRNPATFDIQIGSAAAGLAKYDFVDIEAPLVVMEHEDLRRIPAAVSLDTDALYVQHNGIQPMINASLNRLGIPVLGGRVTEELLRGLRGKKYLQQSKFLYIGEIPSFSAPLGPWDFFQVQERFGVRVRHIETNEFFRFYDRCAENEVKEELQRWRGDFAEVKTDEVAESELLSQTRVYLAMKALAAREDANGITINCGRVTEERPVVACLAFSRLIDEGIICACEGDITAMLSSLLLHGVTGQAITMGNFGATKGHFEAKEGEVTIEHDLLPLSMAKTKLTIRDYHTRKFGVTGYADVKEEPMTLLNMDPGLDKISVIEGKVKYSVDGGHCRVIIHMSVDGETSRVAETVVGSQHMSMTFGHWASALESTARFLDLDVQKL